MAFACSHFNNISGQNGIFNFDVDGTLQLGSGNISGLQETPPSGGIAIASITHLTPSLSAGTHTFKVKWCVSGGTGTVKADGNRNYTFSVFELR